MAERQFTTQCIKDTVSDILACPVENDLQTFIVGSEIEENVDYHFVTGTLLFAQPGTINGEIYKAEMDYAGAASPDKTTSHFEHIEASINHLAPGMYQRRAQQVTYAVQQTQEFERIARTPLLTLGALAIVKDTSGKTAAMMHISIDFMNAYAIELAEEESDDYNEDHVEEIDTLDHDAYSIDREWRDDTLSFNDWIEARSEWYGTFWDDSSERAIEEEAALLLARVEIARLLLPEEYTNPILTQLLFGHISS